MSNDPDEKKKQRRVHPLEAQPPPPEPSPESPREQRVILHIPVVKPYVMQALIAINAAIFFIAFYIIDQQQFRDLYDWGANNHRYVLQNGQLHRLFSAMFLHGNLMHVVFNMYALWIIGQTVERFFGHARFALIYFLGGLAGSLLSVLLNPASVTSVGASGAVFAIFGAEMVFLYKHQKLLGEMAQAQLRQLVILAGINFLFGIASSFNTSGVSIDNWGHIGGFIGGIALAWIIGPIYIPRRHPTQPDHLAITDINPLEKNQQQVLAYVSVLTITLIVGIVLAGGRLI